MTRGLAVFLAIIAGFCIILANFSVWLGNTIFDRQVFSSTAVTVMKSRPVREAVSASIIDEALKEVPELQEPASSTLKGLIGGFLASGTATPALRDLAESIQESLTSSQPRAVKLNLTATIKQIRPIVARINRQFDVRITTSTWPTNITVVNKGAMPSIYGWGAPFLALGPVIGLLGLALIIGSIAFAGDERWFVLRANGIVLMVSALLFLMLVGTAGGPLSAGIRDENMRVITVNLYSAFASRLSTQTWFVAGAGALLLAAGLLLPRLAGTPPTEQPGKEKTAA